MQFTRFLSETFLAKNFRWSHYLLRITANLKNNSKRKKNILKIEIHGSLHAVYCKWWYVIYLDWIKPASMKCLLQLVSCGFCRRYVINGHAWKYLHWKIGTLNIWVLPPFSTHRSFYWFLKLQQIHIFHRHISNFVVIDPQRICSPAISTSFHCSLCNNCSHCSHCSQCLLVSPSVF